MQIEKEAGQMDQEEMTRRTKEFARQIIALCRRLPNTREGRLMKEADELIAIFVASVDTAKGARG